MSKLPRTKPVVAAVVDAVHAGLISVVSARVCDEVDGAAVGRVESGSERVVTVQLFHSARYSRPPPRQVLPPQSGSVELPLYSTLEVVGAMDVHRSTGWSAQVMIDLPPMRPPTEPMPPEGLHMGARQEVTHEAPVGVAAAVCAIRVMSLSCRWTARIGSRKAWSLTMVTRGRRSSGSCR